MSSLAIWPRSYRSGGRLSRLVFYLLLAFDLLMGSALLVGVPRSYSVSWSAAFQAGVGELIAALIIALLLLGAAAARIVILGRQRRLRWSGGRRKCDRSIDISLFTFSFVCF